MFCRTREGWSIIVPTFCSLQNSQITCTVIVQIHFSFCVAFCCFHLFAVICSSAYSPVPCHAWHAVMGLVWGVFQECKCSQGLSMAVYLLCSSMKSRNTEQGLFYRVRNTCRISPRCIRDIYIYTPQATPTTPYRPINPMD